MRNANQIWEKRGNCKLSNLNNLKAVCYFNNVKSEKFGSSNKMLLWAKNIYDS